MDYFDFIADLKFKSLLERDFEELQECINNKLSKSVMLLSGSIIEAVLLEFFSHNLPENITITQLYKLELNDLLIEAESKNLISKRTKELSVVIKNYRNLIHPGREIRTNESIDFETASVSFSLVKIVLKEAKENYLKLYGYKAEDIYNKIKNDSSTYVIFPQLLQKLNHYEKTRLANMIINNFVENSHDYHDYPFRKYFDVIKQNLDVSDIFDFCKKLVKEVEKGKEEHIIILFILFGDNLGTLSKEEQELVLLYIYNTANQVSSWSEKKDELSFRKIFIYLGLYLTQETIKEKFFNLLTEVVRRSDYTDKEKRDSFFLIYNNLVGNFDKEKVEKCKVYIINNLSTSVTESFYAGLEKYNELPF